MVGQPDWKYGIGFVDEEVLAEHLPPPSTETIILMCGPTPMVELACNPALKKLGYTDEMCFVY